MKNKLLNPIKNLYYSFNPSYNVEELKKIIYKTYSFFSPNEEIPPIEIEFSVLPNGTRGEVKKKGSTYFVCISPSLNTRDNLYPVVYHEAGEIMVNSKWKFASYEEEVGRELSRKKELTLECGSKLLFRIMEYNSGLPMEFFCELSKNLKKDTNLISLRKFEKLCKEWKNEIEKSKIYIDLAHLFFSSFLDKRKIDLRLLFMSLTNVSLSLYFPPLEILYKTRKLQDILTQVEKIDKDDKVEECIQTLNSYKNLLEEIYSLRTYREGFCELISKIMCEKEGINISFKKPLLNFVPFSKDYVFSRDPYDSGAILFLKILEVVGDVRKVAYEFFNSKNFDELIKRLKEYGYNFSLEV